MKKSILLTALLLHLAIFTGFGQPSPCEKTMEESLNQTAETLNRKEVKNLWNIALNAPIIIINPNENKMYFTAIENGNVQPIKEEAWNNKVPLANSFVEYDGKRQVIIMYPSLMHSSCKGRVNLLAHEIFHLHQNNLGIRNAMSTNFYMDEIQGRTLLQMEMKALQQALYGNLESLYDALYIRTYRQSLYPDNNEDLYELNEGLAEYTGMKLSTDSILSYAKNRLNYNINSGYANAFGYATGTAYATLLDGLYPQWKQDKDLNKGMIFLLKKSNPKYVVTVDSLHLNKLFDKYGYSKILSTEKEALKSFGDVAAFEALLKPETPKLSVINNGINFMYNPNDRVIALNNAVLLRNITIKGEWGEIKTKNIIRLNNWSAFYLHPPTETNAGIIKGDGYEIQLNKGWKVVNADGIYKIEKDE
ncbi:MAG: hypothetical protein LBU91_09380 [Bacteroidales bacterium]|jgi:hypothetical protein|nr:hypothetical protein [Bacteroidales bacterium]